MARTIPVIVNGEQMDMDVPEGATEKQIKAKMDELGAVQEKTWGQFAKELIVPQTPVEWGIFLATLPLGGVVGPALKGTVLAAKLAARPILKALTGGVTGRILRAGAGGATGAAVEDVIGEENAPSVKEGAMRGLTAGLVGEGSAKMLNLASRTMLQNYIRKIGDPKRAAEAIQKILPDLQTGGMEPRDVFATVLSHTGQSVKERLWAQGLDEVATNSQVQSIALPKVARFLKKAGFDAPADGIYSVREALDTLGDLGRLGYESGAAKKAGTALIAQQMRLHAQADIQAAIGGKATGLLQFAQGRNALYEEMFRTLQAKKPQVFPDAGGINMRALQDVILERAFGQTPVNRSVREKLGGHLDDLLQMAWRGAEPLAGRDKPGFLGISLGMGGRGRAFGIPRAPSFAGNAIPSALQNPSVYMDPAAATLLNNMMRSGGEPEDQGMIPGGQ
jgi:hypothetical protein